MTTGRTAFLGDADSVLGFRALGVETYSPVDRESIRRTFSSLVREKVSVIMVTEDILEKVEDMVADTLGLPVPSVVVLPGVSGSRHRGEDAIRTLIIKAVGVDLMSEDE